MITPRIKYGHPILVNALGDAIQDIVTPEELEKLQKTFRNLLDICSPNQGDSQELKMQLSYKVLEWIPKLAMHLAFINSMQCPDMLRSTWKRSWLTGLVLCITQSAYHKPLNMRLSTYTERIFLSEFSSWNRHLPCKNIQRIVSRNAKRCRRWTDAEFLQLNFIGKHGSLEDFDFDEEDEEDYDWGFEDDDDEDDYEE